MSVLKDVSARRAYQHSHTDEKAKYDALWKQADALSLLSSRIIKDKVAKDSARGWMTGMESFAV